jgi:asparagine synthase (glutamine-hydrolysing)
MCGIAGIYNFDGAPVARERLERMAAVMRHRGPDDEGFLIDGAFGMAMRRLSIIDLDTGRQPISSEDGAVSVTFNGEIYNHLEIRAELESRGHRFTTKSDTESIVHLYEDCGAELAHRLSGMFAIAVWDAPARRLSLFRDRLGIKPLYYCIHKNELLFGSEIKCILAASDVPRAADPAGLDYYLRTQYFPLDGTIFKNIRKLRAGHRAIVDASGHRIEKYWEIIFPPIREPVGEREAVEKFRELFFRSVERRLMSDVPIGAFLSGGIDSGAVVRAMSELSGEKIKTFTIGFGAEAPGFSELAPAQTVARACGAAPYERVIHAEEVIELMDRVLGHFDEPFGGGLHMFMVSELAAKHVKVALTGIGADELLGGYERQKRLRLLTAYTRAPGIARAAALASACAIEKLSGANPLAAKIRKLDRLASAQQNELYFEWISVFDDSLRRAVYRSDFYETSIERPIGAAVEKALGDALPENYEDRISFLELKTTLADDFLNYTDKMSMAWGIEARVPFLDHELVEYVVSLPHDLKVRGGQTKYLLKKAMEGLLPEEIIHRRKQPFLLPLGIWFRGPLRPLVEKTLITGELAAAAYIDPSAARELARQHLDGNADLTWQIWSLMLVEYWFRKYAD